MTISIKTTSQNSVGLTVDGQTEVSALACLEKIISSGLLVPDEGAGMALALGGTATAVGDGTNATGLITGEVVDQGSALIGFGTASFSAAAATNDGSAPYVSATSYAGATGADLVFTFSITQSDTSASGAEAAETSQSLVLAVDFAEWDFAGGPVEFGVSLPDMQASTLAGQLGAGNTADFTAELIALGQDTICDLTFGVLTLEDQLSDVSAAAVIGVA